MSRVAVASYPVLDAADRSWIENIRGQHDPQATRLPAHMTLVFPAAVDAPSVRNELEAVARAQAPIPFVIRWVRPVRDVFGAGGHVFLVPDEGFAEISALHAALYQGALAASRPPDIPFVPHITIAASHDWATCERVARSLSPIDRLIRGRLETVALLDVTTSEIATIASFGLGA